MKYIYGGRYFNRKVDVLDEAQRNALIGRVTFH